MSDQILCPNEAEPESKLRAFAETHSAMSEDEMLTRAREAYIAANHSSRFTARRIRAGRADKRLAATLTALRDLQRPMAAIVADRDEATVALILRGTLGYDEMSDDARRALAASIAIGVAMGRQG